MANQFEMFASAQGKPKEGLPKTWRELCDFEAGTADSDQAHADEKEHELTLRGFLF